MKKLILTLSILLITIISYSQHQTISVNGIELDKHYTQSQIYNILGTPKSIKPNEFDAWYSRYYYNNSSFAFGHEVWEYIRTHRLYQRYSFTEEELDRINWIVEYPQQKDGD